MMIEKNHSCGIEKECKSKELHSVLCSASCNHEQHEKNGFSNSNFSNFDKDNVWDQVDCSIKYYLSSEGTLF